MFLLPSPVEPFTVGGRHFFVKRDDLIHPDFSGNKYRKLQAFLHTRNDAIDTVVSFGGVQSNAMLSIAAMCRLKGWSFRYIARTVPSYLKSSPAGNYKRALELGMQLEETAPDLYRDAVASARSDTETLFIPQGGADSAAKRGVRRLALEIESWRKARGIGALCVATPSGTGTTAAFLAASLPHCTILTTPAVGDAAYLRRQISALMPVPGNLAVLDTKKRYRFGTPHPDLSACYLALEQAGIEFDLLYAPVMWTALLEHDIKETVLYVHSGGVSGNETMLARYRRAGYAAP